MDENFQQKLFVFQGTFNPIHNAHLDVAKYILQKYSPAKIIFIPAFKPPHKSYDLKMSTHRLKMVIEAVFGNSSFAVSDIEFKRNNLSYTVNTIEKLKKIHKIDGKINFIIGSDAFLKIDSWYKSEKLKQMLKFFVFKRSDKFTQTMFDTLKEEGYDFILMDKDFENISSSEIRKNFYKNSKVKEFLPQKVASYIEKNELYAD